MMIYLNKQIAYRQMSLFITSSPGREAISGGCIFIYIVVLLERAAKMS
jgi:F0F1-type ATP synthase alpha subunit